MVGGAADAAVFFAGHDNGRLDGAVVMAVCVFAMLNHADQRLGKRIRQHEETKGWGMKMREKRKKGLNVADLK